MKLATLILAAGLMFAAGCGMSVDVTKTAKGFYSPTTPGEVDVLMLGPTRPYMELGSVSVYGCDPSDTARMHNALRAKSAPLGASAVVLINSGIDQNAQLWATGAAIRYTD